MSLLVKLLIDEEYNPQLYFSSDHIYIDNTSQTLLMPFYSTPSNSNFVINVPQYLGELKNVGIL